MTYHDEHPHGAHKVVEVSKTYERLVCLHIVLALAALAAGILGIVFVAGVSVFPYLIAAAIWTWLLTAFEIWTTRRRNGAYHRWAILFFRWSIFSAWTTTLVLSVIQMVKFAHVKDQWKADERKKLSMRLYFALATAILNCLLSLILGIMFLFALADHTHPYDDYAEQRVNFAWGNGTPTTKETKASPLSGQNASREEMHRRGAEGEDRSDREIMDALRRGLPHRMA